MILNPFTAPVHTRFIKIDNSFVSNIFDKMLLINGDSWLQLSLIFLRDNEKQEEEENNSKENFDINLILNLLLKLNSVKNTNNNRSYFSIEKNINIIIENYLKKIELSDKKNYYQLKRIIQEIKNETRYNNLEDNSQDVYNENLIKIYKLYEKINNNEFRNISNDSRVINVRNKYNDNSQKNLTINEKKNVQEVSKLLIKKSNLIIENNFKSELKNANSVYKINTTKNITTSKSSVILGLKASNTFVVKSLIENNTLFHKVILNKAYNEVFQDINSTIILKNTDIKKENNYAKNLLIDIDHYRRNLIENIKELQIINQYYKNDENKLLTEHKRAENLFKQLLVYGNENSYSAIEEKNLVENIINDFNNWINIKNNNERKYNFNFLIDKIHQLKINNEEILINQLLEIENIKKDINRVNNSTNNFNLIQKFNIIKQIHEKEKRLIELSFKEDVIKNNILNKKIDNNFIKSEIISIKNQFKEEILLQEKNRVQVSNQNNILFENTKVNYENAYVNNNEQDINNYNLNSITQDIRNYDNFDYKTEKHASINIGENVINKLNRSIKNHAFNFNGVIKRLSNLNIININNLTNKELLEQSFSINKPIKNNFKSNFNFPLDSKTIYKKTNKIEDSILHNQLMLNINNYENILIKDIKELKILKRQNNIDINENKLVHIINEIKGESNKLIINQTRNIRSNEIRESNKKEILLQGKNRVQVSNQNNILIENTKVNYENAYVNNNEQDINNYNLNSITQDIRNYDNFDYKTEKHASINIGENVINKLNSSIKNHAFNFNSVIKRLSNLNIININNLTNKELLKQSFSINKSIKNNFKSNFNFPLDSKTIYKKTNKIEDSILPNQLMLSINNYENILIKDIKELKILKRQNNIDINENKLVHIINEIKREFNKLIINQTKNISSNEILEKNIEKINETIKLKLNEIREINNAEVNNYINSILESIENNNNSEIKSKNTHKYYIGQDIIINQLEKLQNIIYQSALEQSFSNKNLIIKEHKENKINMLKKIVSKNLQIQRDSHRNKYKYESANIILKNFNIIKESNLEQPLFNVIYDNKKFIVKNIIKRELIEEIKSYLSLRRSNTGHEGDNKTLWSKKKEHLISINEKIILDSYRLYLNKSLNNNNILDYKMNSFLGDNHKGINQYYKLINKDSLSISDKKSIIYTYNEINKEFVKLTQNNSVNLLKKDTRSKNTYNKNFLLNERNYKDEIVLNNTVNNASANILKNKIKTKLNLIQSSAVKEYLLINHFQNEVNINKVLQEGNANLFYRPQLSELNNIFSLNNKERFNINNYLQKHKARQAPYLARTLINNNARINKSIVKLDLSKLIKSYNKNYASIFNNLYKENNTMILLPENNEVNNSNSRHSLTNHNKNEITNLESSAKEFYDVNFKYKKNTIINEQEKDVEINNTRTNDIFNEQQISKIINETVEKIVEKKLSESKELEISEEERVNNLSKKVIAKIERNLNYEKRRRGLI